MVTPAMLRYVQDSLANGKTKEQIQKELLLAGGWQISDIDEVFAAAQGRIVMPKKEKSSFIGGFLLFLVLLGGVGYAAWHFYGPEIKAKALSLINSQQQSTQEPPAQEPVQPEPTPVTTPEAVVDQYAPGMPGYVAVASVIKASNVNAEKDRPISIAQQLDLTGDGVPELYVHTGRSTAAGDEYTVIKVEEGIPQVVATNYKGKIKQFFPLIGATADGKYSDSVQLLPEMQAIVANSYSMYGKKSDYCLAVAYIWNATNKIFEYNKTLSDQKTQELLPVCQQGPSAQTTTPPTTSDTSVQVAPSVQ